MLSDFQDILARTLVISCTGFFSLYCFTLPLWVRRPQKIIEERLGAVNGTGCLMDLDEMSVFKASLTEFVGTLILSLSPALVVEHPSLFISHPFFNATIIGTIVSICLL